MRSSIHLGLLLLAVVAQCAAAQRVWIVDNVNSAGADFPDLPPALASPLVTHGDVLLIRSSGTYSGANTSKGVSIVARGTVIIGGNTPNWIGLAVSNLPAGRHFSLRNVRVDYLVTLDNCAGSVHLDGVTVPGFSVSYGPFFVSLSITACSAVTLQGCRIDGRPALSCTNSSVSITASTLTGLWGAFVLEPPFYMAPGAGLVSTNCNLQIAFSAIIGGSGYPGPGGSCREGLIAQGGTLSLGGRLGIAGVTAGAPGGTEAISAIVLSNMAAGSVAIDPRVPLTSRNGAPTIQGAPANAVHTVAALGLVRAFTVSATVLRRQGDVAALLGGPSVPPVAGPFGRVWLDPGIRIFLGGSVIGASEAWTLPINVPNIPVLFGVPFGLQAAVLSGTTYEATNATVLVLGA